MMKNHIYKQPVFWGAIIAALAVILIVLALGSERQTSTIIHVVNPVTQMRDNEVISIPLAALEKRMSLPRKLGAFIGEKQLITQMIDKDGDGHKDRLLILVSMGGDERKAITIKKAERQNHRQMVRASIWQRMGADKTEKGGKTILTGGKLVEKTRLSVPKSHKLGDGLFRFEGVGWESQLVGYRLYLDYRHAIDIFGKKTPSLVLHKVGHDNGNYHQMAGWGMDVLKVGKSLGLGSIGVFDKGKVLRMAEGVRISYKQGEVGPLFASFHTLHKGWVIGGQKHRLVSKYGIHAYSHLTKAKISLKPDDGQFVTGFVKNENTDLIRSQQNGKWAYLASFGKQSVIKDELGMAVFYKKTDLEKISSDEYSHLVVFTPETKTAKYYLMGAWEQEKNGVSSKKQFTNLLNQYLMRLNFPLEILYP